MVDWIRKPQHSNVASRREGLGQRRVRRGELLPPKYLILPSCHVATHTHYSVCKPVFCLVLWLMAEKRWSLHSIQDYNDQNVLAQTQISGAETLIGPVWVRSLFQTASNLREGCRVHKHKHSSWEHPLWIEWLLKRSILHWIDTLRAGEKPGGAPTSKKRSWWKQMRRHIYRVRKKAKQEGSGQKLWRDAFQEGNSSQQIQHYLEVR